MINDQKMAEKVYVSLYITSMVLVAIYMISTKQYAGELSQFQNYNTSFELSILLGYSILGFIAAYLFYVVTKNKKIFLSTTPLRVNTLRLVGVFFCLVILQLIFLLVTDVGRVGSQATSPYSPVFALLNVDAFFGFFYYNINYF